MKGTVSADDIIYQAMKGASAGLDLDRVGEALQDAVEALAKQAAAAKQAVYDGTDPVMLSKAMNNAVKVVDMLARLMSFAKGQPDSRPDFGKAWLAELSAEQLEQVSRWLEAKGQ